ncbi:microcin C ABC transporter permease YejB [Sphingobium nicotianae]|uniref:Microcin C ABC transporter permease YejB n=1 Tax=Sphingobium nicotianae TaxID=2782607 RepID=A0A9X1DE42_9SPHN|nr:microcin C ABC transporter permease YejB [Sphingobium nicotianae]MBT2188240.1 microcin C ABC transporter permease YejB [Sphingobium nicotianae]
MSGIWGYTLRRLLFMIPTLIGIVTIAFVIIQFVPGGPIDQIAARMSGEGTSATANFDGSNPSGPTDGSGATTSGLPPEVAKQLEKLYGFDRPVHERYFKMLKDFATFDLGTSYYKDEKVIDLIKSKMPVSISLGFWTILLTYLISIPLGIRKAVRVGTAFDNWTSFLIIVGYAIPAFLFAILLVVFFAGGNYWNIFPARGLTSDNWDDLSMMGKIGDYFWHITLPILAISIGSFANLTMLCKNSVLDEINKQYVTTARAKGLGETQVLYGHVFRNAMMIVVAGFPHAFITVLFASSLLIEVIFSLDGIGLLSFEAAMNRDYPVMLGSLFVFSLLGLVANLIGDICYVLVDPRIDFERRDV